jgi:restriction endonuclease S subunit
MRLSRNAEGGSKLAGLHVPIAPPADQSRIVAELDALQAKVDAVKKLQSETQAELDALLPSILDKAFKGELLGSHEEVKWQITHT